MYYPGRLSTTGVLLRERQREALEMRSSWCGGSRDGSDTAKRQGRGKCLEDKEPRNRFFPGSSRRKQPC